MASANPNKTYVQISLTHEFGSTFPTHEIWIPGAHKAQSTGRHMYKAPRQADACNLGQQGAYIMVRTEVTSSEPECTWFIPSQDQGHQAHR